MLTSEQLSVKQNSCANCSHARFSNSTQLNQDTWECRAPENLSEVFDIVTGAAIAATRYCKDIRNPRITRHLRSQDHKQYVSFETLDTLLLCPWQEVVKIYNPDGSFKFNLSIYEHATPLTMPPDIGDYVHTNRPKIKPLSKTTVEDLL